jgi:Fe-Mn family superoxide dismutase
MEIHHTRHHAAYVGNLNTAVKEHSAIAAMPLESLLAKLNEMPDSIRTALQNNGGGHANHSMFWRIMGPGGGALAGDLKTDIDRDLGGLPQLKESFNAAGMRLFGSGWVFVTVDQQGKLALETRPNQDTPLMDGKRILMGNDLWEHAYYLNYQNRRADYLNAWWDVVNWTVISERYSLAKKGKLLI